MRKCKSVRGASDHDIVFVESSIIEGKSNTSSRKLVLWKNVNRSTLKEDGQQFVEDFTTKFNSSTPIQQPVIQRWLLKAFRNLCTTKNVIVQVQPTLYQRKSPKTLQKEETSLPESKKKKKKPKKQHSLNRTLQGLSACRKNHRSSANLPWHKRF